MGLFDVNMPLIYGEGGTKAFRRLQEEIVKLSSDLSIFAWDPISEPKTGIDALASKPDEFAAYKDIVPSYQSRHFTRTNKGIEMETILHRVLCDDKKERLMLPIGKRKNGRLDVGIILRKVGHNIYMRHGNMRPFSDEQITSSTRKSLFYLAIPHISTTYDYFLNTSRKSAILIPGDKSGTFHTTSPVPEYAWDCEDRLFFNNRHWGGSDWRAVKLIYKAAGSMRDREFVVLFSLEDEMPRCYLLEWREEFTVMFDRKHQTETTRLEDFRFAVKGATNEINMRGEGTRLSLSLYPVCPDHLSGTQFRMELQETPCGSPASGTPTHVISRLLGPVSAGRDIPRSPKVRFCVDLTDRFRLIMERMAIGRAALRRRDVGQDYKTMAGTIDSQSEAASDRPGRRTKVFSQFQGTDESVAGSGSRVAFAALSLHTPPDMRPGAINVGLDVVPVSGKGF